jgi:hypothetical protein
LREPVLVTDLAFPDRENLPSCGLQPFGIFEIATAVSLKFRHPVFEPTLGRLHKRAFGTFMLMPEASMDENDFPSADERNVWAARQITPMQAVAIPKCPEQHPDDEFGTRVLRPDRTHDGRTGLRRGAHLGVGVETPAAASCFPQKNDENIKRTLAAVRSALQKVAANHCREMALMVAEDGVVRVTATLSKKQEAALRAMAARNKVSVAWLVRYAIDELIKSSTEPQLPFDLRVGSR